MNPRQNEILQLVNDRKRVQVTELSDIIGVSGVTIRQDLNFLEQQGYLKRVHGAATALQSDDIDTRLEVRFDIKQTLANKAADLVAPNETVLIEGGSANALLARTLAERGDVTIITPSAYLYCAPYPQYIGQYHLVGWRVSTPRRKPRWPAHQTLY